MANVYVRQAAAGAGTGADWANAYTTLAAAFTAKAAGDDFWMAGDHAETQTGAMTLTCPGTLAAPCRVICVNHAGTVPPVAADLLTTASVTTTTNGAMTITGCFYAYGITFSCATTTGTTFTIASGTVHQEQIYEACAIKNLSTATSTVNIGSSTSGAGTRIVWDNTTFGLGAATSTILVQGQLEFLWKNTATAISGATFPTSLFNLGTSQTRSGLFMLDGVDLIALSGKTIVAAQAGSSMFYIKDCKLPASITIAATPTSPASYTHVMRSASGATAYTVEKYGYRGTQTTETTIFRTGGKTINSTPVAMKLIGTANATQRYPFISSPMVVNNAATGASRTLTLYGVWAGGALPTNAEVWMEVGYLGSAATPQLTFDRGTIATPLTAPSYQVTDTSTWGGSTTKFKLTATFTPQLAGEIYVTVRVATTNATYIDPLPVLS